jgi:hypothetical protein
MYVRTYVCMYVCVCVYVCKYVLCTYEYAYVCTIYCIYTCKNSHVPGQYLVSVLIKEGTTCSSVSCSLIRSTYKGMR